MALMAHLASCHLEKRTRKLTVWCLVLAESVLAYSNNKNVVFKLASTFSLPTLGRAVFFDLNPPPSGPLNQETFRTMKLLGPENKPPIVENLEIQRDVYCCRESMIYRR